MNGSVSYEGALLSGNISINAGANLEELTADHNGVYLPSQGKDGFSKVTVDVPDPVLDDITITMNGNYTPPSGVDGYDNIQVEVPIPTPVLDDITITVNGTYTPPSGVDGYDEIVVNVPLPANGIYKQTLSGLPSPIATFTGADAPIDSLKASIDSSGWSSCVVNRTGKNLYNYATRVEGYFIQDNGSIQSNADSCYSAPMPVKSGTFVIFSGYTSIGGTKRLHAYNKDGQWISRIGLAVPSANTSYSISATIPDGCFYVKLSMLKADTDVQLELGNQPTTYEAYNGNTYTIPFTDGTNPVTVYNGIIDITGGSWSGKDSSNNDITGIFTPVAIRSDGLTNISVDCGEVTECKYYSETP